MSQNKEFSNENEFYISDKELHELLTSICLEPRRNARFLNTLSLLEYTGARKILKSQKAQTISAELLSHCSEEIRHAFMLKRLALKIAGPSIDDYNEENLLCGQEGNIYFQTLDREINQVLKPSIKEDKLSWVNYLYTTLLIEDRALWLYPCYEELLQVQNISGVLSAILKDEEKHLEQIKFQLEKEDSAFENNYQNFKLTEEKAFYTFFKSLRNSILN